MKNKTANEMQATVELMKLGPQSQNNINNTFYNIYKWGRYPREMGVRQQEILKNSKITKG